MFQMILRTINSRLFSSVSTARCVPRAPLGPQHSLKMPDIGPNVCRGCGTHSNETIHTPHLGYRYRCEELSTYLPYRFSDSYSKPTRICLSVFKHASEYLYHRLSNISLCLQLNSKTRFFRNTNQG